MRPKLQDLPLLNKKLIGYWLQIVLTTACQQSYVIVVEYNMITLIYTTDTTCMKIWIGILDYSVISVKLILNYGCYVHTYNEIPSWSEAHWVQMSVGKYQEKWTRNKEDHTSSYQLHGNG